MTDVDAPRDLVEIFRAAIMRAHADDWTMEDTAEAAYICADAASGLVDENRRLRERVQELQEELDLARARQIAERRTVSDTAGR